MQRRISMSRLHPGVFLCRELRENDEESKYTDNEEITISPWEK